MPALQKIPIAPELTFDVLAAGDDGAPLVLLLHGFAESMHCWRAQMITLADMGYRALARASAATRQLPAPIRAIPRATTSTA